MRIPRCTRCGSLTGRLTALGMCGECALIAPRIETEACFNLHEDGTAACSYNAYVHLTLDRETSMSALERMYDEPAPLGEVFGRRYWLYLGQHWSAERGVTTEELVDAAKAFGFDACDPKWSDDRQMAQAEAKDRLGEALRYEERELIRQAEVVDRRAKHARKLDWAKAVLAGEEEGRVQGRQPIPLDVKTRVWQRDRGRCADCESKEHLEFDHIIPIAMGGSNTERNLQLLCEPCNRSKGASL